MEMRELKDAIAAHHKSAQMLAQEVKSARDGQRALDSRIDRLETLAGRSDLGGYRPGGESLEDREAKQAFGAYLRNPHSPKVKAELEAKAVSGATDAGGGYAIPEVISTDIRARLRDVSVMRQICRVETASTSDFKILVDVAGSSSGWAGEGDTRSATNTPQLHEVAPTFGTNYALITASEEIVNDAMFDIQSWLVRRTVEELALTEGEAFLIGNGTKKPTGLLTAPIVSAGDFDSPARPEGSFKYLPTGFADSFGGDQTASPPGNPGDVLVQAVYDLRAPYRQNARWLMNSATAGVIRKFKDAEGRYLWSESMLAGQPPLLLGYPVAIDEAMPDIGTNTHPVAFGDFERAYTIVDLQGLRITLDDNVTTPGQLRWYIRRRVGGQVTDTHALRFIKCAAS
ncbi:phage capsid protein [Roseibium aquae]|uniref:Phage capsid protein n=1 Tax=Roseibium aquae TaxID=1323746 RepID=A0A916TNI6_9HYPH|nr:phage major capsid protein [Roseibium aquae]GGB62995.1 phage capsid protein [Roseibium aquae]